MPAMLASPRPGSGRAAIAVCAALSLGISLIAARANAQCDEAAAPWQNHPATGDWALPCPTPTEVPAACAPRPCEDNCEVPCGPSCEEAAGACWANGGAWLAEVLGPRDRIWFRGEYLGWWTKSATLPPLVTTSPADTAYENAGIWGKSGTTILVGGDNANEGLRSGARLTLGCWLDDCHAAGLEISYLFLSQTAAEYNLTSDGSLILARPFYDVDGAAQSAIVVAYHSDTSPAYERTGAIDVRSTSELSSVELVLRKALILQSDRRLDFLVGYRYARFREDVSVDASTYIVEDPRIASETTIQTSDLFNVKNEFNGFDFGFAAKTRCCRWSLEMSAKLALGNTHSRANVGGSQTLSAPGETPVHYNDGMLALSTNSGSYNRNAFAVMPELGVTLGYDLTCRLKATVGYTFLYWSNVVRPADLIDTELNPSQFPPDELSGNPSPKFQWVSTDYWAQGVTAGLEYRY
jgi:hypothetical protein